MKVVFLGPCIAKKEEAIGDKRVRGAIDAILTFEEIVKWWKEEGIDLCRCEEEPMGNPSPKVNQLYPVSGGVITSVLAAVPEENYYKVHIDGLKACMELFEELEKGEIEHCFFEVNVCEGGCIKGPASDKWQQSLIKAKKGIEEQVKHREEADEIVQNGVEMYKEFTDRHVREQEPTKEQMEEVLHAMGKYTAADELNCGACGYPTCRAKATAIFQNKAEVSMCLPYALAQAESMSNIVMDVTPSMILIVDKEMRIRECNKKAQEMLGVSREEALERYIFEFVEEKDIADVLDKKEPIIHRKLKLESMNLTVVESIIYIENLESALVTYQDITKEEKAKEQRLNLKMETVDMAQKVIDKQMMIAQEIAGLLGETTAETKVTLTKLRNSMLTAEED